ncbi:hypothetical protein BH10BAC1_BH10BAC1_03160 [soil metagenome]
MKKILFLNFIAITSVSLAQTSSTNSPASAINTMCAFSYSSTVGYTPAANVMASDNVYATAVHCDCCDQNTQCLTVSDFGFSIPLGAVINGIVLEVEKKRSAGGSSGIVEDNGLQIIKGGLLTGPNKSQYGVNWPLTDTYVTYGSSSDLWGTTWTAADINASDFGISLASISYVCGATITTSIDHVRMTVYYTSTTGISMKASSDDAIFTFPNPVASGKTITFSNIKKIEQVIISDALGKIVLNTSSESNEIVLPTITSGIYFYSILERGEWYKGNISVE